MTAYDLFHTQYASKYPRSNSRKFPLGTLALFGPDNRTNTKIVAAVVMSEGGEPILKRFTGEEIKGNVEVLGQIRTFFDEHRVRSLVATNNNIGCPHEEGSDYPSDEDCPFCPYWKDK